MSNVITVVVGNKGQKGSKMLHVDVDNKKIRVGDSKLFVPVADFFGSLDKGTARRCRKAIDRAGHRSIAAITRNNGVGNAVASRVLKMFPKVAKLAA